MPRPYEHIRAEMIANIDSGKFLLGDLIEPKTYFKLKLKDGILVKEKYELHGRKISLHEIRYLTYKEHERLGNDELFSH